MFKMRSYENYVKCNRINVCVFYKKFFFKCLGTLSLSLCNICKHHKKRGKANNSYEINGKFNLRVVMGTIYIYILARSMNKVSK